MSPWHYPEPVRKAPLIPEEAAADAAFDAILAIYEAQGRKLVGPIRDVLRRSAGLTTLPALIRALQGGSRAVESAIDFASLGASLTEELGPVMLGALRRGGKLALESLPATLEPSLAVVIDPFAVQYMQGHGAELVREITDSSRKAVRAATTAALRQGLSPVAAARQIRNSIGLTQHQATAVANYRAGLIEVAEGRMERSALASRFGLSRDTLRGNVTLGRVDQLTERYRDRWVVHRANMIARTEGVRAVNAGQMRMWVEARQRGALGPKAVAVWHVTPDERTCIAGPNAKVMTSDGWKRIHDVEVGDYVMTHKDRMCRVVATDRRHYNGPMIRVHLPGRSLSAVAMTPDHPVLTARGWVEARGLRDDDELCVSGVPCTDCGQVVPQGPRLYSTADRCCPSCSAKRSNRSRWAKPGERERLTEANHKRWTDPDSRERQRQALLDPEHPIHSDDARAKATDGIRRRFRLDPEYYERIAENNRRTAKLPTHPFKHITKDQREAATKKALSSRGRNSWGNTYLEKKTRWFLGQIGVAFEEQWQYAWTDADGRERAGYADFYLPGPNVVIECDGWYHQQDEGVAKADILKTGSLESRGHHVLRFTGEEIRERFWEVASAIREHCCITTVRARRIERYEASRVVLYDLQVEGDESFVVGGLVVHNCEICLPMHGQPVSVGEGFETGLGDVVGFPPAHPGCRCNIGVFTTRQRGSRRGTKETRERVRELQVEADVEPIEA